METKEIVEATEMAVEAAAGEFVGFKPNDLTKGILIGTGVAVGGELLWKYLIEPFVVRPIKNKRKAKKEEQAIIDAEATVEEVVEEIE